MLCVIAIMLVFYMGRVLYGDNGLYELYRLRQDLSGLKEENTRLEKENMDLFHTINRLKNDPVYIEHVARQELQMIGKEEIVFNFQNSLRKEFPKTGSENLKNSIDQNLPGDNPLNINPKIDIGKNILKPGSGKGGSKDSGEKIIQKSGGKKNGLLPSKKNTPKPGSEKDTLKNSPAKKTAKDGSQPQPQEPANSAKKAAPAGGINGESLNDESPTISD